MSAVGAEGVNAAEPGPASDPEAPYVRLGVVGLVSHAPTGRGEAKWLLLARAEGSECWDPPGGRVEGGEDLESAVRREVMEETGLSVRVAGPCYAFLTYHKGERLVAVSMACRPVGDVSGIRLEKENASAWRWVTAAEWEALSREGRTSWRDEHVRVTTRLASTMWEDMADEPG